MSRKFQEPTKLLLAVNEMNQTYIFDTFKASYQKCIGTLQGFTQFSLKKIENQNFFLRYESTSQNSIEYIHIYIIHMLDIGNHKRAEYSTHTLILSYSNTMHIHTPSHTHIHSHMHYHSLILSHHTHTRTNIIHSHTHTH